MDIQQANTILELSVEGTMLGAAERLGVTQPAISAALGTVEQKLGIKIFVRSRRGLTLTEHGTNLLPLVRQMLEVNKEIEQFGKQLPMDEGVVRIAGRQGFMQYVFPALLSRLQVKFPKIRIEYALSGDQSEVLDSLRKGIVDFAFAASPKIKSIHAEVFFQDPVWLAVSSNHSLARKRSITFSDLAALPICLPAKNDRLRRPIDALLRKAKARNIVLETNDYTLMRNIISDGQCGGFIYAHMLTRDFKELHPLAVRGFELKRDLTILNRRDDIAPHAETARKFFIAEAMKLLSQAARRGKR